MDISFCDFSIDNQHSWSEEDEDGVRTCMCCGLIREVWQ